MFIKKSCQRRYIIEPEKLIYYGEFRALFCSIYLEKSKLNWNNYNQ